MISSTGLAENMVQTCLQPTYCFSLVRLFHSLVAQHSWQGAVFTLKRGIPFEGVPLTDDVFVLKCIMFTRLTGAGT